MIEKITNLYKKYTIPGEFSYESYKTSIERLKVIFGIPAPKLPSAFISKEALSASLLFSILIFIKLTPLLHSFYKMGPTGLEPVTLCL